MNVFEPLVREISFPNDEAKWLKFWKENHIFQAQLDLSKKRSDALGYKPFVFYEGPPTANGIPHPGHILTRCVKDLFPRFYAMRGYDVPRKAGWDTHGLPVEIEVEKILGIEGKAAIESYGIEPFVKKCKESVWKYSDLWTKMTERIAYWVDLENPYITYHQSYIESVWWSIKQIFSAGLLYHGFKIVPWCPRCGTALSSLEVGQGYKEVEDPSVYVAFRAKENPNHYFIAWTTTPWTLLSNAALAVGKEFDYDVVKINDETWIMASILRQSVMGKIEHIVADTIKGSKLIGQEYEPLFKFAKADKPAYRIVSGDFVGLDVGTGIVHIAPAFGEDDYRVGQQNDLPMINLVKSDGTFTDEVHDWKNRFVKECDSEIIRTLKERKQLVKSERYKHEYPFCWRCPSPLLYYPRPAWYIATSTIKDKMIENNKKIEWYPQHIQNGRFGNFLETNVDWALSRERYWGTPLPIWKCSCGHVVCIGSEKELRERSITSDTLSDTIELHRPYVDEVLLKCDQCNGEMRRVSEVIDCWYDSGAMPFAQFGYPHLAGSDKMLQEAFPASFISEAIDQTRGWFYSLLAISTLLKECAIKKQEDQTLAPFRKTEYPIPYKKCLVIGHVCDERGYKMSKSKGNYLDPWKIIDRDGADALRWYFLSSNQPWTSIRFYDSAIADSQKDYLIRIRNVLSFFVIYANLDGFDPFDGGVIKPANLNANSFEKSSTYVQTAKRSLLDRWMCSKVESATGCVTAYLESMDILRAAQTLLDLVDGLSNWYVRRSRDRFWMSEKNTDKWSAYWTLYESLLRIAVLAAPFTPFYAEEIYQRLAAKPAKGSLPLSIHLNEWTAVNESAVDFEVESRMDAIREISSLGLSARASEKIKVRQPLSKAIVILTNPKQEDSLTDLIEVATDELNVKQLQFAEDASQYVTYTVKPNFQILGPKLGSQVKTCAAMLSKQDAASIVNDLTIKGSYTMEFCGSNVTFTPDELDVRITAKSGFSAANGKIGVIVLDTTITEQLVREGIARELVNRIQGIRKELDLPYDARIAVRIKTSGTVACAALEYCETIAAETLAVDFKVEYEALDIVREYVIENEEVCISLKKI